MKRSIFTFVAVMLITVMSNGQTKLSGTPVGTPDDLAGTGESVATMFDGDFYTGFDTGSAVKNTAWAGLDFGEGVQMDLDSIRFSIRIPGNLDNIELMKERLAGAKVYGANTLTFDGLDGATNAMTADTTGNLLYEIPLSAFDTVTIEEWVNVKLLSNTETSYRYLLIFFDAGSYGNCSEFEVYGSESTTTAITSSKTSKSFNAFLSNEDLMISSDREVQAAVEVYSVSGALVARRILDIFNGNNRVELSTTLIENNLYVVRVKVGNEVYSQKLLK